VSTQNYEPKGCRFYDAASGREMMLVDEDEPRKSIRGWILYRHPDGQWVTLRVATPEDRERIVELMRRDVGRVW